MPGFGFGFRRIGKKSASTSKKTYTGTISVSNGSVLQSITVAKSMFGSAIPIPGWTITKINTIIIGDASVTITSVTSSSSNWVLGFTGHAGFSGGAGLAVSIQS